MDIWTVAIAILSAPLWLPAVAAVRQWRDLTEVDEPQWGGGAAAPADAAELVVRKRLVRHLEHGEYGYVAVRNAGRDPQDRLWVRTTAVADREVSLLRPVRIERVGTRWTVSGFVGAVGMFSSRGLRRRGFEPASLHPKAGPSAS